MLRLGNGTIPYQLVFPEVFYQGNGGKGGFDAILGNPPWDKAITEPKAFFSEYAPWILDAESEGDWEGSRERLLSLDSTLGNKYEEYKLSQKSPVLIASRMNSGITDGDRFSQGHPELFVLFTTRAIERLANPASGYVGFLCGGGLISNASSKSARRAILSNSYPLALLQFDNANRLFADLPPILEFCVFACSARQSANSFRFSLRLKQYEALQKGPFEYPTLDDIAASAAAGFILGASATGNNQTSLKEGLRSWWGIDLTAEADPAKREYHKPISELIGSNDADARLHRCSREILSLGYAAFRTGPSIQQYSDIPEQRHSRWSTNLHDAISLLDSRIRGSLPSLCHYRLTVRRTCGSPKSNERSLISTLLPPGFICSDKLMTERRPFDRPAWKALVACAAWNSFILDSLARRIISTTFGLAQMSAVTLPRVTPEAELFLAHCSLRLVCLHDGYAELWHNEIGSHWREQGEQHKWPAVADADSRWQVRACIDAVVAMFYGVSRSHYETVLGSFSHRTFPKAPYLCLEAYDELKDKGLKAFIQEHDPYWDVPLNESLPKLVIDLAIPGQASASLGPLFDGAAAEVVVPAQPPIKTSSTTAVLPRTYRVAVTPTKGANSAFATIAELLRSRGVITSSDAQQATGLDAAGVRPHLQQLVQQGLAVTEGQRRGMRYRRVDG
jgi:hypothetical protein